MGHRWFITSFYLIIESSSVGNHWIKENPSMGNHWIIEKPSMGFHWVIENPSKIDPINVKNRSKKRLFVPLS